ncbi:hypothetical protein [Arthrobacter bambusae]|uniref:hypothetical protein n=1 Tax=Arthrobacter bambusae TaxID=1338426 RepID=UPI0027843F40|nr:hypothetical protein [Arthrobacter bambusae]MDQ0241399.1 hypothetical protein [Arthrobacter bambusae]
MSFNPPEGVDALQGVTEKTLAWLEQKGLDTKHVEPNGEYVVAEHARLKWVVPDAEAVGDTHRFILTEGSPSGEWVSTITVRKPRDGRPWFWMDVEGNEWAGAPRLVRTLIDEYACSDRGVRLTTRPVIVRAQQVDQLIQLLRRSGRRTVSFIAGSSVGLPIREWTELVADILKQTTGQASAYVLDPVATTIFNQRVGQGFGVLPGMLRTYLPDLNLEDSQDAARHRFLTAESIASQHKGRLRKTLSYKAREVAQASLLDDKIRILDRRIDELEVRIGPVSPGHHAKRIGVVSNAATQLDQGDVEEASVVPAGLPIVQSDPSPEHGVDEDSSTRRNLQLGDAELYLALRGLLEEFAGGDCSLRAVESVRALLVSGEAAVAGNARLLAKFDQKSAALDEASVENARLRHLVDDLELDAWETWEHLEAQSATARAAQDAELKLRAMLARAGSEDVDWSQFDETVLPELSVPENFNSLVESVADLEYVLFTGDQDLTAGLDEHDAIGRWCDMTWSILLALSDYARFKAEGAQIAGVHAYLESPLPGGRAYHPSRHARDESESVKNNPSYSAPRTLVVPTTVDPSGKVFMGAHFRIAKHGLVSPRLHYFDATSTIGKVIVGYIGPHLPNTQTN